ncbi:MAG: hypothetical protein ACTSVI_03305 [Promethearchaeota archaeon]
MENYNEEKRKILLGMFFITSTWFIVLGSLSRTISISLANDLFIASISLLLIAGFYIVIKKPYRLYLSGILTLGLLLFALFIITNLFLQILIFFLLIGNVVYIVFYLGIYTACIDQVNEQGIMSEDYIPSFSIKMDDKDHERHGK